ncbi:hypothetical protein NLU13_7232 [Sarocladium strictum]|uniref:N-acetyltransferase domain-containing protein n=1 Tax=Sarocladium strictum TaxID=5046 RepID=A0AA39L5M0_SARSR|nr:hypothetical protein NLU13_7232 [Sarocladium strictum]
MRRLTHCGSQRCPKRFADRDARAISINHLHRHAATCWRAASGGGGKEGKSLFRRPASRASPAAAMPPFSVFPATEADAASSIAVENAAFSGGALDGILFPGPFPDEDSGETRPAQLAREVREDPSMRFMKVVDTESGEPIAFARWLVNDANWEPKERAFGPGANQEACEILFGQMAKAHKERWIGKPHVYLKLLVTEPKRQGHGAGSLLLQALAEEVDSLGLPAYLEATQVGKPLYEKFGFREVGMLVGNFEKWGGPREHENYLMIREAKV